MSELPVSVRSGSPTLAGKMKRLRKGASLTLSQLSRLSGISPSTLSKIENGQLSPTYEKIAALARALDVDVGALFTARDVTTPLARRSICLSGQGVRHPTRLYDYQVLCADLTQKKFIPLLTAIKARSVKEFPSLLRHEGEEFIYVLSGSLTVHTDFYTPFTLGVGDSCYFDSTMGHACVSTGEQDAQVLWVCSNVQLPRNST